MGKGNIVKQQHMTFSNQGKVHSLLISIDPELSLSMAPSGRIIVWYTSTHSEVIADSSSFPVQMDTRNRVQFILILSLKLSIIFLDQSLSVLQI